MRRPYSQIFLKDKNILQKMLRHIECPPSLPILEIGPGEGDLTRVLLDHGFRVIAVEIDVRMVQRLEETFESFLQTRQLQLIHADFLRVPWPDLLAHVDQGEMCVVSNIPYAVTGPILERLVEAARWLPRVYLTVQWEVGQRIVASPGSKTYGALSVWVQTVYIPRLLFKIKRTSFWPVPEVDSAFVAWTRRDPPQVPYAEQPTFFAWVRKLFQFRRKTLRRILRDLGVLSYVEPVLDESILQKRPEELDIPTFYRLFRIHASESR